MGAEGSGMTFEMVVSVPTEGLRPEITPEMLVEGFKAWLQTFPLPVDVVRVQHVAEVPR